MLKACFDCHIKKPHIEFDISHRNKNALSRVCNACITIRKSIIYKTCTQCGKYAHKSVFAVSSKLPGQTGTCKECIAAARTFLISSKIEAEILDKKLCNSCCKTLPIDNFEFRQDTKKYRNCCKSCRNKQHIKSSIDSRTKARHKLRHTSQTYLYNLKMSAKCADCGVEGLHPICYDFDHIKGEKIQSVGKMVGHVSLIVLKREISKCEIRCANCHAHKTYKECAYKGKSFKHAKFKIVASLKENTSCKICNIYLPYYCMHYDHIDPKNKKFSIADMNKLKLSWQELLEEIEKCQLLCANCHRAKTYVLNDNIKNRKLL